jgi:hypothetical protein
MMRFHDPEKNSQEAKIDVNLLKYCLCGEQTSNHQIFNMLEEVYTRTAEKFYLPVQPDFLVNLQQLKRDIEKQSLTFELQNHQDLLEEIVITTPRMIVSMNVKQDGKWTFKTDIIDHFLKLDEVNTRLEKQGQAKTMVQVLLVSKKIWDTDKKQPNEMVEYKRLRNYLRHEREKDIPFIVIFFEDVLELIKKLD